MANIKDLKSKIKSTKGTLKITQAMKLVSAAKLNKAQHAIQNARPYANELELTIKTVSALCEEYSHEYLVEKPENKKTLLLVLSANKGLCGGYNSQLAKKVKTFLNETDLEIEVSYIGKKVRDLVKKQAKEKTFYTFAKTDPSFLDMKKVADELSEAFLSGEYGRILVAHNIFHSAINFEPTVKQVLPMALDNKEKEALKEQFPFDFKYDPDPKQILDTLIPEAYTSSLWTAQLDSIAAEHGSRMTAMDSAVGNCKDAIRSMTIKMNKLRQAAITTELIEVVSGAESLKG